MSARALCKRVPDFDVIDLLAIVTVSNIEMYAFLRSVLALPQRLPIYGNILFKAVYIKCIAIIMCA